MLFLTELKQSGLCFYRIVRIMKSMASLSNSVGVFTETLRYLKRAQSPEESIVQLKTEWAQKILARLKIDLKVIGQVSEMESIVLLGNHLSYLDIPLLLSCAGNLSFVAKQEIDSWPIFGEAARKIDTVFVKRESATSRKSARKSIYEALDQKQRIVIFPSGTTCLVEKKPWKKGAFEIAHEKDVFIQPFRITYNPSRAVAYIDDDFFLSHLYNLCGVERIEATIEFHEPVKVQNPAWDCHHWHYWSRGLVDAPQSH